MPPEVGDPEPLPPVRRMRAMAASRMSARVEPLMIRATRYAVLLPLAYRTVLLPVAWLSVAVGYGAAPTLTVITWVAVAGNIAGVTVRLRVQDRSGRVTWSLLAADAVLTIAVCALGGVSPPGGSVALVSLTGTVALWTMCHGVVAGVLVAVAGVVLRCLVLTLTPGERIGRGDVASLVNASGLLLAAVVTATGALILLGLATRIALAIGLRIGHDSERVRTERVLHDTVLQGLEAMAVGVRADETEPGPQLARLRVTARAQAAELRRALTDTGSTDGLSAELAALAAEMAREGLRAELALSDIGDDRLSEARRTAVRDAAREALRNTIKHAGTREVVVRMEECDGGIVVITRDHGVGYDEDQRPPGFGVSESMKARLAEVGGWARIESAPGRGTRVTMWVPQ
ncbi:ATP-binding protein [Amycolatopsis sp. K13G38]|uniref:ATP-binding protein n=2 Tax=Amycolatopsis acididurans TaxID=2724524 RepID=A0ABX1J9U2_9PSEU|nr:ATP-binding protein [Amycolatopsis acididurans]